jgi:hypothetical protein
MKTIYYFLVNTESFLRTFEEFLDVKIRILSFKPLNEINRLYFFCSFFQMLVNNDFLLENDIDSSSKKNNFLKCSWKKK